MSSCDIKGVFEFKSIPVHHAEMYRDEYGNVRSDYRYGTDDKSIFNSYGYRINYNNRNIYYSGDSNYIDYYDALRDLEFGEIDEFYQDTCLADYEGNVHLSLRELCELVPKELRHKVYCIHRDCDELIDSAEEEGFNVVYTSEHERSERRLCKMIKEQREIFANATEEAKEDFK